MNPRRIYTSLEECKKENPDLSEAHYELARYSIETCGRFETFPIRLKHRKTVGDFVRKIEEAHRIAGRSKLHYREAA